MPCDYSKYPKDWKQIRENILLREDDKCRFCNAPNKSAHWKTGSNVVLTVAHLNHDISDNRYYNLAALCQRCHNILDMPHRRKKRDNA